MKKIAFPFKALLTAVMNSKGFIFGLIVLAFLFSFSNCKKENQLPSCTITYPNNGDEFEQGDTIVISVEANDNDGLIAEINFYIDDIGVFSSTSFPYTYTWNTSGLTTGSHIIKVTVKDNDGGSQTDECTISIIGNATVITTEASSVTHNSAISGGNITNDGGTSILERGVCWNTSQNPTLSNEHTTDGSGSGSYTSTITGLTQNTTYYVRAYATNSVGTTYGSEVTFTTPTTPTLTTTAISAITENSAQSGGNITDNGGAIVTARGVCWNTSSNPTTADSKTTDGNGTGSFTSSLTGLSSETTYYVRAYATNSIGTSYGNEVTFSTPTTPSLITTAISTITENSAKSGGYVTYDGGTTVTARGVCWNTSSNPTTADSKTTDGSGTGSFNSSLTGLSSETTYYIRAYATNSIGTSYGNELIFTTYKADAITDYDGNYYNIVTIGDQVWMAENLKATNYADGTAIQLVENKSAWDALDYTDKAYCYYNNILSNLDIYGALYTWAAAMNGANSSNANPSSVQGVCPDGWHVPSDAEWTQLTDYLGGESVSGGKLKETGTAHWYSPNTGATNESGFTALPGGYRSYSGAFYTIETNGYWWSSTEYNTTIAWHWSMRHSVSYVHRSYNRKESGRSVRCVRDD